MTDLLTRLLGRLPVGWLQLTHNKGRLFSALAGVAFANILVFMQLGFMGAMSNSIIKIYNAMDADVVISASDMHTLSESSLIPRKHLLAAFTATGVERVTPLYVGRITWLRDDEITTALTVFGVQPRDGLFRAVPEPAELELLDQAVMDVLTRRVPPEYFAAIEAGSPLRFEVNGRTLSVVDTLRIGPGFDGDGYVIVSDQTFFRLFPTRSAASPNHIFIRKSAGARLSDVLANVTEAVDSSEVLVRTLSETSRADQIYQNTKRPTGIIFGFGVIIGILVGIVIVYQVLATDVADHLAEYATFKAMGYPQRYFLSIILEEAVLLATIGFIPGFLLSLGLYRAMVRLTGLPVEMSVGRAVFVFAGTIVMCALSGAFATRRLAAADPADLF